MTREKKPSKIVLVSYPKIVFLYPTFVVSLAVAIYLSVARQPLDTANTGAIILSVVLVPTGQRQALDPPYTGPYDGEHLDHLSRLGLQ